MLRRTQALIGKDNIEKLRQSHVAVFGIGGVGSYTCEALARAGVGSLTIVDYDTIALSNINRQLHAMHSTVGQYKVDVMRERILNINPDATVHSIKSFLLGEGDGSELSWDYDYIADAVDTVTAKIYLAKKACALDIPIISAMGTGNKLNPGMFQIDDLYNTSVCPLAKVMRKELKNVGISRLKVLYSTETPIQPEHPDEETSPNTPASISFVPSVAGLMIAGEIIKELCGLW